MRIKCSKSIFFVDLLTNDKGLYDCLTEFFTFVRINK